MLFRSVDGCGLRLPEILDLLTKSLKGLERGFICIDALDEFSAKQRAQLWDSLQRVVRGCPNTRLFLTGRPQIRAEVEGNFPGDASLVEIEPTPCWIVAYRAWGYAGLRMQYAVRRRKGFRHMSVWL